MIDYLREDAQLIAAIFLWVFATVFLGPVIYALLPLTVFMFGRREAWAHMLFGFLIILIMSDMNPGLVPMRKIKTAKYAYIIALSLILLFEQRRFAPLAGVFKLFLPFFVYSFFPLVFGNDPITGIQKTISYALLFLVVPNYVLTGFRQMGWHFFRNMVYFIVSLLLFSWFMVYFTPSWWTFVSGRFRGLFGNPNGLGIFSFLFFMLFSTVTRLRPELFGRLAKWFIYAVILFFLVKCGSRTSLVATFMYLFFGRFFALSPFIGFIAFILFMAIIEFVSSNLAYVVVTLGLQDYFRVETLDDGSGRYVAWRFAWEKIQDYFLFGGGFGNDEYIMRSNYAYLRTLGHHGGVHNSYLTMWFNTGIIGILIFLRSYVLIFIKAGKRIPSAFGIMFAVMFSALYESWLTGSLNPFTIMLVIIMTMLTEEEIVSGEDPIAHRTVEDQDAEADAPPILPSAVG